jgi:patatin-like phospholipase/acyl hydrolase
MALYRVLTLDGGGAKGFYSLGVLREIEALVGTRLHRKFDLIFGTSTGAIIAAMVALGHSVEEIHDLCKKHVVSVMALKKSAQKTTRLQALAREVFGTESLRM